MTEESFSQKEKFEFEDRLSKIKAIMNKVIPEMDNDFFVKNNKDKSLTKIGNVYYAGGTLCIDIVCEEDKGLIMLNISDETITIIIGEKTTRGLMTIQALWFAFTVYKETKGFHRKYYRECYKKSCIRHLYSLLMNRHKASDFLPGWSSELEDLIIENAIKYTESPEFDSVLNSIING